MCMRTAVVITTVGSSDLPAVKALDTGCRECGWMYWAVGDVSTPGDFSLSHGTYLARSSHASLGWRLGELLPDRCYTLKMLGYLEALKAGCRIIVETDDDNLPLAEFWSPRASQVLAKRVETSGWVNLYSVFTDTHVWPRGLPLKYCRRRPTLTETPSLVTSPIHQGLADANPDVDAIFRLVGELPVFFKGRDVVATSEGLTPFNSQNTTWFDPAFPLMYLPTFCSFRMTDIWRSFVALAWLIRAGMPLVFTPATVTQDRNDHNLMRDFEDEVPGYLRNEQIVELLLRDDALGGQAMAPSEFLRSAYRLLVHSDVFPEDELVLVEAWLSDVARARGEVSE